MSIAEFVDQYSVELATAKQVPLHKKVEWRLKQALRPKEKTVAAHPYPMVSLFHWRPESGDFVNFGDELARVIVDLMLARKGASMLDAAPRAAHLVTVGSALHMADEGSAIWGTGLHGASLAHDHAYRSIDVRAVRGPLTAKFLRQRGVTVPVVYGDPGLLLPQLDQGRFRATGKHKLGIVPNLHDMEFVARTGMEKRFPALRMIDPRRAWNLVVQDIVDHEFILASSLHGLVIADAYGIPCRYVRLTEKENILKYNDYYLGTGRMLEYARSIEEALEMGGAAPLRYDPAPLMSAFPYDLWGL